MLKKKKGRCIVKPFRKKHPQLSRGEFPCIQLFSRRLCEIPVTFEGQSPSLLWRCVDAWYNSESLAQFQFPTPPMSAFLVVRPIDMSLARNTRVQTRVALTYEQSTGIYIPSSIYLISSQLSPYDLPFVLVHVVSTIKHK